LANLVISIVTVSYNSFRTIRDTIESVFNQDYPRIEYIIIDGGSSDGTVELIKSYGNRIDKFISEPDLGIYDAINKGIRLCTGEIVGILNSDDIFCNAKVISRIAREFIESNIDSLYGDAQFVDPANLSRIKRYYSSKYFRNSRFRYGFMPAHPSFYVKTLLFEKFGYYKIDYKIAADFELMMRFLLINNISSKYLDFPFVSMRTGGVSNRTLCSKYILNIEIRRACRENGISTNYFNIYSKYFLKIFEFIGIMTPARIFK